MIACSAPISGLPAGLEQHLDGLLRCLQAGEVAVEREQLPAREFEVDVGLGVAGVDLREHRAFLRVDLAADILEPEGAEPLGEAAEPAAGLHA